MNRRNHHEVKEMKLEDGSRLISPEQIHDGAVQYFKTFMEVGARVCGTEFGGIGSRGDTLGG